MLDTMLVGKVCKWQLHSSFIHIYWSANQNVDPKIEDYENQSHRSKIRKR